MAAHRWTWSIANGFSANPLPGQLIQVRRHCGSSVCCNPDHLYLSTTNGALLSVEAATELARSRRDGEVHDEVPANTEVLNGQHDGLTSSVGLDDDLNSVYAAEVDQQPEVDLAEVDPAEEPEPEVHRSDLAEDSVSSAPGQVRRSCARWIVHQSPELEDIAEALAAAVHPWPDGEFDDRLVPALLAELNPRANLHHPDLREVAAERLLRLSRVAAETGYDALAIEFRVASAALDGSTLRTPLDSVETGELAEFLGLSERRSVAPQGRERGARLGPRGPIDRAALGALLLGMVKSGSTDLGAALGTPPLGIDVLAVIEDRPDLAVLAKTQARIDSLDDRAADLLIRQELTPGPATDDDTLRRRWGMAPERVLQILANARQVVCAGLRDELRELAPVFEPLSDRVFPTSRLLRALEVLATATGATTPAAVAALNAAGPWVHEHGWTMHKSKVAEVVASVDAMFETSDGYGYVSEQDVLAHLSYLFFQEADVLAYASEALDMISVGAGSWSLRISDHNRVATALRLIGRPASTKEVANVAGIRDLKRVDSILSSIGSVVRPESDLWAHAGWLDDPSGGVIEEICNWLDRHGGEARTGRLVEVLTDRLDVTEAAVEATLARPVFTVEGDVVRRSPALQLRRPVARGRAIDVGARWGQRIRLRERHFMGFSIAVDAEIACANGVRPGDALSVPVVGHRETAMLTWLPPNPDFTVRLNGLDRLLADLGCEPGDEVIVVPDPDGVEVVSRAVELDAVMRASRLSAEARLATRRQQVEPPNLDAQPEIAEHSDPLLDLLSED